MTFLSIVVGDFIRIASVVQLMVLVEEAPESILIVGVIFLIVVDDFVLVNY